MKILSRTSSSRKSSSRKKSSHKETYYFSRKHVKDTITTINDKEYINHVIIPLYRTPSMSEEIVGYYSSYNIHTMTDTSCKRMIEATFTTPNGTILAKSNEHTMDSTDKCHLINSAGKRMHFESILGSTFYKTSTIVVDILSTYHRKVTIST